MAITTRPPAPRTDLERLPRRTGYLVAVVVNAALLYAVHRILDWDIVPFLTEDFSRLIPVMSLSLGAAIAVNAVYVAYDPPWFRALAGLGLNAISLLVAVRTFQVFPFDFSVYSVEWPEIVARIVLIVAIGGTVVAMVAELTKFAAAVGRIIDRQS